MYMCGICGKFNFASSKPVEPDLLRKMCNLMEYRGPDDEGYYISGPVGLGMRRLSIIDVAGGHQPIHNEDKSIWVVCNGEIYNFPELRAKLIQKGHKFKTKTDIETVVHLYEDYGVNCIEHLRGMFGLAVWDGKKQRLLLARDRIGKKPLFYSEVNGSLIFGSALKSVLQNPEVKREINMEALHHYLTYQYVPEPATIFTQVQKLPPAHYLVCERSGMKVERYWDLKFGPKINITETEAAERVRELVEEATKIRLISEVPLGAFLSGGVDSTIVVGLMSQLMDKPVKTFSIGFEEASYNELDYARIAAKRFSTEHQEFIVKPNAIEVLPDLVWHFEEPMADSSGIPTFYVSKMTRQYVTVALNGDGGDESFAGYERYLAFFLSNYYKLIPSALREKIILPLVEKLPESAHRRSFSRRLKRFAKAISLPDEERYARWMTIFDNELKDFIYSDEMKQKVGKKDSIDYLKAAFKQADSSDFLDRLQYVDIVTYLPGALTVKMDRMSMANSLEGRSPLLDHKVMEFAATLPAEMKLKGKTSKYILKKAMADILPQEILTRGKQGFGVPLGAWFRGELKDLTYQMLLEPRTKSRGYFNPDNIRSMLDEHQSGLTDHSHRIWTLLVLELWHRTFIDRTELDTPLSLNSK